ncbi:universal stress protein [Sphaerisporangium rufum]|uniref:Universal stress protein n=1 Tax=Sphaerisporangium rufum TaxID=1381558 RepID=A0A919V1V6_9ACTN|nr:universal stress protein [Sphaerisporangium rufum]GII81476.1 universal stress protein [Sphaerisporangium rufum]
MSAPVVVGADGSPAALAAVRWAADDAVRRDTGLRIVHVTEPWVFDLPLTTPPGFHDSRTRQARAVLAEAAGAARDRVPGIGVLTAEAIGDPRRELLAEAGKAQVLVVGSRGLGGFAGLLLGSVSIGVAGHAGCPVVAVRAAGNEEPGEPGEPGERRERREIVVGHDGSPYSEAALDYAFEEAALRGALVRAVYAWQVSAFLPMLASYTPELDRVYDLGLRAAKEQLRPWREKYPAVEVRDAMVRAHPVAALVEASAAADLVVVGSRGRGAVGAAVLGSVGHGVLHHARCPVAVVRSRYPAPVPDRDEEPEGGRPA